MDDDDAHAETPSPPYQGEDAAAAIGESSYARHRATHAKTNTLDDYDNDRSAHRRATGSNDADADDAGELSTTEDDDSTYDDSSYTEETSEDDEGGDGFRPTRRRRRRRGVETDANASAGGLDDDAVRAARAKRRRARRERDARREGSRRESATSKFAVCGTVFEVDAKYAPINRLVKVPTESCVARETWRRIKKWR